jgi:hyperosmotically inducible protein
MRKMLALTLAGIALLAGCTSMTGKSAGDSVDDAQITATVKSRLAKENLGSVTKIDVDTNLGTVYLTGVAETPAFRDRATAIARQVPGVRQVVNNLAIQSAGAGSAATSGTGRTAGQVIDDASITAAVKTKLAAEKLSTLTRVDVDTRNGVVTLTGNVDSETTRRRAIEVARGIQGVRDVVSNLRVGS